MTESQADQTYSVVSTGAILDGFELEAVRNAFVKLAGVTAEKAENIIGKKCILKKGTDHKSAYQYKKALENIGLAVTIKRAKPVAPEKVSLSLALEPIETPKDDADEASSTQVAEGMMICPKCGAEQPKAEQCEACGVIIEKVLDQSEKNEEIRPEQHASLHFARVQEEKRQQEEAPEDTVIEESLRVTALVIGGVVAAAGAWLWYFVAMQFDFESGLVAWAIGGAVGAAVAWTGSRGDISGVACGIFALAAIFGGKYLTMSSFQSQFSDMFVQQLQNEESREYFELSKSEARAYAALDKTDQNIRIFMADNGYTEAYEPENVTAEELEIFKTDTVPYFDTLATDLSFEAWIDQQTQAFTGESTWDLVAESLGAIDVLFILFGVGTAFRLGRGNG